MRGSKEVEITGISADSRTAAPGNLFLAKKGTAHDGAHYIQQAVAAGAAVIATDIYDPFLKQTQIVHPKVQEIEAKLAARFYGNASKELFVVGVTGTKGKTTTSYLVKHLLDGFSEPGRLCGLVGTVETVVGPQRFYSTLTTHDVIANHKLLREMAMKGCFAASLEVSSHGLAQGRVDEVEFKVGIFTNLYPDHLDYHRDMDDYAAAKKKLFEKCTERALFNSDSEFFPVMKEGCRAPILTFGLKEGADIRASDIAFTAFRTDFSVSYLGKRCPFTTGLIGRFNVYNMLGAIGVGIHLGLKLEEISSILSRFETVPGRLERVPNGCGIQVFVDYAHNGEALDNVLKTLQEIAPKRVIAVFGCGGNRDPGRRAGMARAAEAGADISLVTSDNPRQEDPQEICRQIVAGFQDPKKAIVELDRKQAIYLAISMAQEGDIVVIAGKGHEKIQIFSHQTIPFDDVEIAKEALQIRSGSDILSSS